MSPLPTVSGNFENTSYEFWAPGVYSPSHNCLLGLAACTRLQNIFLSKVCVQSIKRLVNTCHITLTSNGKSPPFYGKDLDPPATETSVKIYTCRNKDVVVVVVTYSFWFFSASEPRPLYLEKAKKKQKKHWGDWESLETKITRYQKKLMHMLAMTVLNLLCKVNV